MPIAISPHFLDIDFPSGMSIDQKIEVFSDQIQGWQLDIARQCVEKIQHSGFAILQIIFSYFEMVGKLKIGYNKNSKNGNSKEHFKLGFIDVFKQEYDKDPAIVGKAIDVIYESVRCGLYHIGMTGPNIQLGDFENPLYFEPPDKVAINPNKLVTVLQSHFQSYVRQLRDSKNQPLRENFDNFLASK